MDARGRIVDSLPLGEAGYLDVRLPGALPPTPYARWGEGPVLVLLLGLALGLWVAARRRPA
jgi:apolipoprotein N-acyltransferase